MISEKISKARSAEFRDGTYMNDNSNNFKSLSPAQQSGCPDNQIASETNKSDNPISKTVKYNTEPIGLHNPQTLYLAMIKC